MSYRILAELAPVVAVLLVAGLFRSFPARVFSIPSRALGWLARTRRRAVVNSAVLTFVSCATINWISPCPTMVPDEFSYLLASDTFAHGRLTNPAHPLWQHFESFHVNPFPTYQSRYPPGQGLFLAAGQALTGFPEVGVWLGMAAASAALCWMLLAWTPPRWALFGALLPALRFGSLPLWDQYWFAYWTTTFWGGAVAMLGAALVFGALPRILRSATRGDAVWLGVGLVVLANTRPYEGLTAVLPVAAMLFVWAWRRRADITRVATATGGVLLLGLLAMGYYNFRGTGDPFKLPYIVQMELYEAAPLFIFQDPPPAKTYNHEPLRAYYHDFMLEGYGKKRAGSGLTPGHLRLTFQFFWGLALYLAAACAFGRPHGRWAMFAAGIVVVEALASAITSYANVLRPHYMAPAAPLFVLLAVCGLRRMRTFRFGGRAVGRPVAESIIAVSLLSMAPALALRTDLGPNYHNVPLARRPAIASQLAANGANHLIVVTYGPQHDPHQPWVSNGADIEGAPVIWARDMGRETNQRLLDYYRDRAIWRLYADEMPVRLVPYDRSLNNALQSTDAP